MCPLLPSTPSAQRMLQVNIHFLHRSQKLSHFIGASRSNVCLCQRFIGVVFRPACGHLDSLQHKNIMHSAPYRLGTSLGIIISPQSRCPHPQAVSLTAPTKQQESKGEETSSSYHLMPSLLILCVSRSASERRPRLVIWVMRVVYVNWLAATPPRVISPRTRMASSTRPYLLTAPKDHPGLTMCSRNLPL